MDDLQKLIVTFFILTIITTAISLCMFFVEVPYKSTSVCTENHNINTNTSDNSIINTNDQAMTCKYTNAKDPSPIMNGIINANIVIGVIFISLSAYAYIKNRKNIHSH
jgi:tellurite resistance protein TehA-like permease